MAVAITSKRLLRHEGITHKAKKQHAIECHAFDYIDLITSEVMKRQILLQKEF